MQRGKPALVSVFLSFVCMITVSSRLCSRDLVVRVNHLKKEAPSESLNCSLYTPTPEDYEQNCPGTTIKCFASEMGVLADEWEVKAGQSLRDRLGKLARIFKQMESECPQCEGLKEENATTFLGNLLETLQKINNKHC